MHMATRGSVYVRISQDRGGEGLGVQRQEQDCRKLADSLGWTVAKVYEDNDVSAYSGKRRPAYAELLADIESGDVHAVVAWHPDRLHRSPRELEEYIDLAERMKVVTHTVQAGKWDLSTPSGRAVARTLGAWARYESEHKGDRIRSARRQQALAGGWHGGIRPYGFEPDGVTVRDYEAQKIVRAVESVLAGVSLRSCVRDLNERGIPTATARGPWTSVALKDTIMRPRTAGLSSHLGEVVGPAVWPAIVPEDTWRAVCGILSDTSRRTNHRGGTVRWLGSGLYICGVCEQATLRVGTAGNKRKPAYRCSARDSRITGGHVTRAAEELDLYVESVIVARLSEPGVFESLLPPVDEADTTPLHVEQMALQQRADELANLFAGGAVTARQLATATETIRARSDEIADELAQASVRGPLAELSHTDDLERLWFGTAAGRSDGLPLGKRRAVLDALLTVTVLPARRGQRAGGLYFNPQFVGIEWRQ